MNITRKIVLGSLLAQSVAVLGLASPVSAGPATASRPPDGTYTYSIVQNGSAIGNSRVVIKTAAGAISVTEEASMGPIHANTKMDYDTRTLAQNGYTADIAANGHSQHVVMVPQNGAVNVVVPGQSVDLKAVAGAPLILLADNLVASNLFVPAILHAQATGVFTDALLLGGRTIRAQVLAGATPESLTVSVEGVEIHYSYDATSFLVRQITLPAQNITIKLMSTT